MSKYASEPWHMMSIAELEEKLKSDHLRGMTHKLSRTRLNRLGRNELFHPSIAGYGSCVRAIFSDASLLLLLLICMIALCFSRWNTAITTVVILIVSSVVTTGAYLKTKRIREAMATFSSPSVHIIRSGQHLQAEATMIVPGDLIVLSRGDVVPCDLRLIDCDDRFSVCTLHRFDGKHVSYVQYPKSAKRVYDIEESCEPLARENMLFAGSVVEQGNAYAFVVATGEDTYWGALLGEHCLAGAVGEVTCLGRMRGYVNRYSFWMCALLLPITVIGLLAGGDTIGLFDVFLTALSLVVASMSEQLLIIGRIVTACNLIRAALPAKNEQSAIIKNYSAIETLGQVTDLFLVDHAALSDGQLHPHKIWTAGALYDATEWQNEHIAHLCILVYLYGRYAGATMLLDRNDEERGTTFRFSDLLKGSEELLGETKFDRESVDIRTVAAENTADGLNVHLRFKGNCVQSIKIFCSEGKECLAQCGAHSVGDDIVVLNEEKREELYRQYDTFRSEGCQILIYLTYRENQWVFEGMLAFHEVFDLTLSEKIQSLENHQIRVSLFFRKDSEEEIKVLLRSGAISLEREILHAENLHATQTNLWSAYREYRVLAGFSDYEFVELLEQCRREKRVTAVVGFSYEDTQLLSAADLGFACDDTMFYSNVAMMDQKPLPLVSETMAKKRISVSSLRRIADVLVHRTVGHGGVLDGVLTAVHAARSIHIQMTLLLQYLLVVQFLRMTMILIPLIFGMISMSASQILISGLWVDLGYILMLAFHRCDEKQLRRIPINHRFFDSPIHHRADWVCAAIICGSLISVTGGLLCRFSVFPQRGGYELYMFLSLVVVQTVIIWLLMYSSRSDSFLRVNLGTVCILLLIFTMLALIILIPQFALAFGCSGISWYALLFSLLSVPYFCISWLLSRLFCGRVAALVRKKFT